MKNDKILIDRIEYGLEKSEDIILGNRPPTQRANNRYFQTVAITKLITNIVLYIHDSAHGDTKEIPKLHISTITNQLVLCSKEYQCELYDDDLDYFWKMLEECLCDSFIPVIDQNTPNNNAVIESMNRVFGKSNPCNNVAESIPNELVAVSSNGDQADLLSVECMTGCENVTHVDPKSISECKNNVVYTTKLIDHVLGMPRNENCPFEISMSLIMEYHIEAVRHDEIIDFLVFAKTILVSIKNSVFVWDNISVRYGFDYPQTVISFVRAIYELYTQIVYLNGNQYPEFYIKSLPDRLVAVRNKFSVSSKYITQFHGILYGVLNDVHVLLPENASIFMHDTIRAIFDSSKKVHEDGTEYVISLDHVDKMLTAAWGHMPIECRKTFNETPFYDDIMNEVYFQFKETNKTSGDTIYRYVKDNILPTLHSFLNSEDCVWKLRNVKSFFAYPMSNILCDLLKPYENDQHSSKL